MQPNPLVYHKTCRSLRSVGLVLLVIYCVSAVCTSPDLQANWNEMELGWWIKKTKWRTRQRQGLWHGVSRLSRIMLHMLCRCRLKLCTYVPPAAICHAAEEPYMHRPLIDVRIDILGWSGKTWATCQRLWECLSIIVMSWEVCGGKTEEQGKTRAQYSQGKESHLIHIVMH